MRLLILKDTYICKMKNAQLFIICCLFIFGCTKKKHSVSGALTHIVSEIKSKDYDLYFDSLGFKYVEFTEDSLFAYKPISWKGQKGLNPPKDTTDTYFINTDYTIGLYTTYSTQKYLQAIKDAKADGWNESKLDSEKNVKADILVLRKGNHKMQLNKLPDDYNELQYLIMLSKE